MDTTGELRQVHYAISRRLSSGRQLELAMGMVDAGRAIAIAGLRLRYPGASGAELQRLWAWERLGAELYLRVYGPATKKNICA